MSIDCDIFLSVYCMQVWNWLGKYDFSSDIWSFISLYYSLLFFIAYTFKGQVNVFAEQVKTETSLSPVHQIL